MVCGMSACNRADTTQYCSGRVFPSWLQWSSEALGSACASEGLWWFLSFLLWMLCSLAVSGSLLSVDWWLSVMMLKGEEFMKAWAQWGAGTKNRRTTRWPQLFYFSVPQLDWQWWKWAATCHTCNDHSWCRCLHGRPWFFYPNIEYCMYFSPMYLHQVVNFITHLQVWI
jgi:hypothetical protein